MRSVLFLVVLVVCLGAAVFTVAEDRCPLTGNTYVFSIEDIDFELSGFDCTFGPGCEADCDFWYGNFDTGPLYHARLPFVCKTNGDVIIAGLPCTLNAQGNLECLVVDISGFHCIQLGSKTWCLPEKPGKFQFEQE